jgi:penicillin-binding protein 2
MTRYPPGSVFKIVTLFAALEEGLASANTSVVCNGTYQVGNRTFRCWNRSGHGLVNTQRAVAESCDVFFYGLGEKLGIERLLKAVKLLGLDGTTGIDLPREMPSISPGPAWKKEHFGTAWYTGDTINAAIGQGFINTTPLGLAVATAAVANGGQAVTPHVVKKIEGVSRSPVPPPLEVKKTRSLPAKASTWAIIRAGMRAAVAWPTGTAKAADIPSVAVAGKTGSAQTQSGATSHAWFVCFAPYDKPEVVCVVLVEQGGAGGETAAPIARQILQSYFSRRQAR